MGRKVANEIEMRGEARIGQHAPGVAAHREHLAAIRQLRQARLLVEDERQVLRATRLNATIQAEVWLAFAWHAVLDCLGLARSAERDAVLVRCHPLVERLQLGIQRARELDAAVGGVEVVEVGPELEHVPDVVGAGEAEAPEDAGRHVVVAHLLAERPREGGGDLRAGRVLARDSNGLADQLAATLEDPVGLARP